MLEDFIQITLFAIAGYFAYGIIKLSLSALKSEREDISHPTVEEIIERSYTFNWVDASDEVCALVCLETNYVLGKVQEEQGIYTAYLRGVELGEYINLAAAKDCVNKYKQILLP